MVGQFSFGKLLKRRRRESSSPVERTPRKTPRNGIREASPSFFGESAAAERAAAALRRGRPSIALKGKQQERQQAQGRLPGEVDDSEAAGDSNCERGREGRSRRREPPAEMLLEDEAMHVRWAEALAGRSVAELDAEELRRLLDAGGVPLKHRHALWPRWFTAPGGADVERLQGEVAEEAAFQIEGDILRTRPQLLGPLERSALRRVLRAYAAANPAVGYCQGMNNIAAVFILLGFDEATALQGCYTLMQGCCPGYHDRDLAGFRLDAAVLEVFVQRLLPKEMLRRLDDLEVPLEVLISEHFLTLASHSWPLAATARLWDVILQEGSPAVFASVLALLKLYLPGENEENENCQKVSKGGKCEVNWADDEEEPINAFRARALQGVTSDFDSFIAEVRRLIPLMPQSEINQLRFEVAGRRKAAH
mmetsp:Transcript_61842/g.201765  ORF Transcript_61842/g.201765 Transcript_61842/m.201765 type:complete len:422 (+) Transcript_61842:143-1408(+)